MRTAKLIRKTTASGIPYEGGNPAARAPGTDRSSRCVSFHPRRPPLPLFAGSAMIEDARVSRCKADHPTGAGNARRKDWRAPDSEHYTPAHALADVCLCPRTRCRPCDRFLGADRPSPTAPTFSSSYSTPWPPRRHRARRKRTLERPYSRPRPARHRRHAVSPRLGDVSLDRTVPCLDLHRTPPHGPRVHGPGRPEISPMRLARPWPSDSTKRATKAPPSTATHGSPTEPRDCCAGSRRRPNHPSEDWLRLQSQEGDQGGGQTLRNIESWLDGRDASRPFFAFVNFLEAHLPYDPPGEFRRGGRGAALRRSNHDDRVGLTSSMPDFTRRSRSTGHRFARSTAGDVRTSDSFFSAPSCPRCANCGLYEETIIVVTSDHGENLGDHGLMEHQFSVHETLLAIPLVIRDPSSSMQPGARKDPAVLTRHLSDRSRTGRSRPRDGRPAGPHSLPSNPILKGTRVPSSPTTDSPAPTSCRFSRT